MGQARQPTGTPSGGRFSSTAHAEPEELELGALTDDAVTGTICMDCRSFVFNNDSSALSLSMSDEEIGEWETRVNESTDGYLVEIADDDINDFDDSPCVCCGTTVAGQRCDVVLTQIPTHDMGDEHTPPT